MMFDELIAFSKTLKRMTKLRSHTQWPQLVAETSFLSVAASSSQRLWHATNNMYSIPTCRVCDIKPCVWNKLNGGSYRPTCGMKCSAVDITRYDNIKATNTERYGSDSPFGDIEVKAKAHKTINRRYGVDHISKVQSVQDKKARACALKNTHGEHLPDIEQMIECGYTQQQIGDQIGISQTRVHALLKKHDLATVTSSGTSSEQTDIYQFICSIYDGNVVQNVNYLIHPLHIDIYIPDKDIAIEYNGVFWHSELSGRSRQYHATKTKLCNSNNTRLIHILSSEWNIKNDIVKSRLRSIFGQTTIIYGRKCTVQKISSSTTKHFCDINHIQGGRYCTHNYGLYHEDVLVAVLSINAHKKYQYELVRFCNALNITVVGGVSKLLSRFVSDYKPSCLMSFADRRWSDGNLYQTLGFEFQYNTQPNYHYFVRNGSTNVLHSRQSFQKHKLAKKLTTFDPLLTEWNNMVNSGYDRIWDCGSSMWIKTF